MLKMTPLNPPTPLPALKKGLTAYRYSLLGPNRGTNTKREEQEVTIPKFQKLPNLNDSKQSMVFFTYSCA
jgi:hypothetical protein